MSPQEFEMAMFARQGRGVAMAGNRNSGSSASWKVRSRMPFCITSRMAQRGPGRWSDRWANVIEAGLVNGLGHVSIEAHRANHLLSWVGQR